MNIYNYKVVNVLVEWKMRIKRFIQEYRISEIIYDRKSLKQFYILINNEKLIYEKEVNLIHGIIYSGDTVIDIGANRGEYTYYFSKLVGINGQVYSFEPGSRAFSLLNEIKSKSRLDNVRLYKMALSDNTGETELIVPYFNRQSQIKSNNPIKGRKEKVKLITLDTFCSAENISNIQFIKCDTEGAEMLVFKGGINTLKTNSPIIMVEIAEPHLTRFGFSINEIYNFFIDLDYSMFIYDYTLNQLIRSTQIIQKSEGHVWSVKDEDLSNNNYIFIPNSKLDTVKDSIAQ